MSKYIVTCGCGDTDEFAKNAFRLLFPDDDCPNISRGGIITTEPKFSEMVLALERAKKPYAHYFKDDKPIEAWDFLKGARVV